MPGVIMAIVGFSLLAMFFRHRWNQARKNAYFNQLRKEQKHQNKINKRNKSQPSYTRETAHPPLPPQKQNKQINPKTYR
jgi:hypothetical protein